MRVAVIFGGRSGEHEVSVRSARAVMEACDAAKKYEVVPIAISKEGKWLSPVESLRLLPADIACKLPQNLLESKLKELTNIDDGSAAAGIIPALSRYGIVAADKQGKRKPQAVVFPVLHGTFGEDGTIQGLLEMASLPYVGCGVLASSCGMDKVTMKALFREAGLPVCNYIWFLRAEWERDRAGVMSRVARRIGFPCFVKPANLGSSVGISKVDARRELEAAIDLAARYDRKIIVEAGLDAREIECGVLGNDEPQASLPGEYVVLDKQAAFLDYTEKYSGTGHVQFVVPAPLSKSQTTRVQRLAVQVFQSVDGAGLSRVDFFLRRDTNELFVNELNSMPGLTDVSGYPQMWQASGLNFKEVVDRLINLALERYAEKQRNETSI